MLFLSEYIIVTVKMSVFVVFIAISKLLCRKGILKKNDLK